MFGWHGGDMPWWGWPVLVVALIRMGFLARHWKADAAALRLWRELRRLDRRIQELEP